MRTRVPPARGARGHGAGAARVHGSFFEDVYALVRAVPRGCVVTYGQVARLLGRSRGARAVGWALRALSGRDQRGVPWHRVLGQGGRLSLGERASGLEQRRLLRAEGVRFKGARVDLQRHAWDPAAALPPDEPARAPQPRSGTAQVSRARRRT